MHVIVSIMYSSVSLSISEREIELRVVKMKYFNVLIKFFFQFLYINSIWFIFLSIFIFIVIHDLMIGYLK